MNKKIIWAIVGLMSVAVIGVIWSQMNVILTSIRTIEEKFNDNVHDALFTVAQMLEREEQREYYRHVANGFSVNFFRSSQLTVKKSNGIHPFEAQYDISLLQKANTKPGSNSLEQFMLQLTDDLSCPHCGKQRNLLYSDFPDMHNAIQRPLEERVDPIKMREMLDQEFLNRGIETPYDFGVYSNIRNSWVLVNDHFLVEEKQSRSTIPGIKDQGYSKPYETFLFSRTIPSPGLLVVQFPNKRGFIWRSLWLNLLGTILFAAIILSCFGYTVNVIFQQKKLSEMKTDFINNMTHEFKTPIATISLAADSISSPMVASDPNKIKRFAGIIKQENKRMNNQVEKVLQMALLDRQEFSLKLNAINIHDVIDMAVQNISLQVEKREGDASTNLIAENPIIEGDATHISNIINNLLDNANKYTPEKPEILVSSRNVGGGVEVIIKDNGVGMSKDALKHIFDKFYRVHTGNLHDVKGFGLGLSYVKAMMDAHNGSIDVRSELGKGSSFILFFPFEVKRKRA